MDLMNPNKWAKLNCPNKRFANLETCEKTKCPHLVYKNHKLFGCKLWMEYTNQSENLEGTANHKE